LFFSQLKRKIGRGPLREIKKTKRYATSKYNKGFFVNFQDIYLLLSLNWGKSVIFPWENSKIW